MRFYRVTSSQATDDISEASAAAHARRAEAEVNLVAAVLSEPRMIATAEKIGVIPHDIEQDDLRIIYLAVDVARLHPKTIVLRVARSALMHAGFWDRGYPLLPAGDSSSTWNDAKLVRLATSYPPSPAMVELAARKLLRIAKSIDRARGHYRDMLHELREAGESNS